MPLSSLYKRFPFQSVSRRMTTSVSLLFNTSTDNYVVVFARSTGIKVQLRDHNEEVPYLQELNDGQLSQKQAVGVMPILRQLVSDGWTEEVKEAVEYIIEKVRPLQQQPEQKWKSISTVSQIERGHLPS